MRIWCALSGHGYGHVAQAIPVLNALAALRPQTIVRLVGAFGRPGLLERLACPWQVEERGQDVGLVQQGPFAVDLAASRTALRAFHADWTQRVEAERAAMAAWAPDVVLADVPYLALAAAARAGVPGVAIASISWDRVVAAYFSLAEPEVHGWWQAMRAAYAEATLALKPAPALGGDTFPRAVAIPPIVRPGTPRREALRAALGLAPDAVLGLLALGGIAPVELPLAGLRAARDVTWLVPPGLPAPPNCISLERLQGWDFAELSASVDVLLGKPGYNTAVEAVAHRVPFLYVRRPLFPDEGPIAAWLADHGAAREITWDTLASEALPVEVEAVRAQPMPAPPALDGAEQAARHVLALREGRTTGA